MEWSDAKAQLAEQGYCIFPGVLDAATTDQVRAKLWAAAEESERRGAATRNVGLDPNRHNVRVFNLLDLDPVFRELIVHPLALEVVEHLLGPSYLVSNFTANIALPGSGSMKLHSDQSIVVPEPWVQPWSLNIIWCLNDVHLKNGATLFIPGSHKVRQRSELPADAEAQLVPFEAPAGSVIVMDGRVWHTSGANVTEDEERALLFGYYSAGFLRPQMNWNAALSPETIADLSPTLRTLLGLEAAANIALATPLLNEGEPLRL
ncbi:phytanoyl-CoA dioxygenase family protein [Zavarzinia sp. CC-PAN008]|uniref:phytanoyl-CoA dioxygenase family protein n=1 Tax=Zavarzinia sp. CC-PAN008 TaxID=3243332 RepID=UPI003F742171